MNRFVVVISISAMLSISSCMRVNNEFIIDDPEGVVSSAELRLCDKFLKLNRSEGVVRRAMPITCEGAGSILVRLSNGKETTCPIGYVTPGAQDTFRYVIKNGECQPVDGARP